MKNALSRFAVCFFKQEVEPARLGIRIQLFVPALLLAFVEPFRKTKKLLRGQAVDGFFDFFHSHVRSVTLREIA